MIRVLPRALANGHLCDRGRDGPGTAMGPPRSIQRKNNYFMSFRSSVAVLVEVAGLERQRYRPGEVPSPCGTRYARAGSMYWITCALVSSDARRSCRSRTPERPLYRIMVFDPVPAAWHGTALGRPNPRPPGEIIREALDPR